MKSSLIALTLAAVAATGLGLGYYLQQKQRAVAELADRAEQARVAAEREADARSRPAPAPEPAPAEGADEDDDEEREYRDLVAKRALTENCLICHEEGMFSGQRLTAAQWKSEIDKMLGWGAMLPESDRGPVEDYLARNFAAETPEVELRRAALADVPTFEVPGDPSAGADGADVAAGGKAFNIVCASCHGPAALGTELGPALAARAVLTHADDYHKVVKDGRRKMPAMNLTLTADQQRDILGWLRSLDVDAAASTAQP